jgi:raffinose/stachyose/melibiose transport system permease protein
MNTLKANSFLMKVWKARRAYYFLVPIFSFLLLFKYEPFVVAVVKSFYDWNGANINEFIGFGNYSRLFQDEAFYKSLGNIGILTIGGLIANLTLPLLAAVLVFHVAHKKMANWLRLLFIIPLVVPGIVVIRIWMWIYAGQDGILNNFLRIIGLETWTHSWLGEQGTALWALVFFNFPWIGGVFFLVYLAGLMAISQELIEAGRIDGMNRRQRFWMLELPLIRSQIKLVILLTVIKEIQNFELPLIFTDGGPGDATITPALHLYHRAFSYNELGYASAIGVIIFLIILLLTIMNTKFLRSTDKID